MSTLLQIDEDRIRLSAIGLFKVGIHLVPTVSNTTLFICKKKYNV